MEKSHKVNTRQMILSLFHSAAVKKSHSMTSSKAPSDCHFLPSRTVSAYPILLYTLI